MVPADGTVRPRARMAARFVCGARGGTGFSFDQNVAKVWSSTESCQRGRREYFAHLCRFLKDISILRMELSDVRHLRMKGCDEESTVRFS